MRSWTHVTVPQEGPRQTPQASTTRPVSGHGGLLVRAPDWSRPAPAFLLGLVPPLLAEWCLLRALRGRGAV